MTRRRNAYSTQPNNPLFGATFTLGQLRNAYTENGGPLTVRHRRFLRRFIRPYTDGGAGLQRRFCVLIPKQWGIDNIPPALFTVLRNHFERANRAWFAANAPWVGYEDFRIPHAAIDNELGTELADDESPDEWEAPAP